MARQLRVQCEIVNRSAEPWLAENGWAAGYHLFDEPTGTLVVDGARTPLAGAVGKSAAFDGDRCSLRSRANTTSTSR